MAESQQNTDFTSTLLTPTGMDCPRALIDLAHCQGIEDPAEIASAYQRLWFPLAQALHDEGQRLGRPVVLGILGGQGTGKTTLGVMVSAILRGLGDRPLSFSLDDLYLPYAQRRSLQSQEPRLKWRGPPGTHNIDQGITVLDHLQAGRPVWVPRFDKSAWGGAGDQGKPERVEGADVVIFEGWFVGVRPVDPKVFEAAPEPIGSEGDRAFARAMNVKLRDYLPLWEHLDRLIILKAIDYRLSYTWRQAAERRIRAQGKAGMSDSEIEQFVTYFWQALHPELLITPLLDNATVTDAVIEIDADHRISRIFAPETLRRS